MCAGMVFLSFETSHVQSQEAQSVANSRLPTLFVIGDSTANNNTVGARGWADSLISHFDLNKINVMNLARAGRSSRTFLIERLWDKVLQEIKAGDVVLIQFGHNDGGPLDTGRARGSLPGTGEETKEVTKPDGGKEMVHTYGWYLRRYIADTRAKGATPILLSLTVRNIWKDGKVERGSGRFGQWASEVALDQGVRFLDLTTLIANEYEKLGPEKVQPLFAGDHTHTSPAGAELNAALVVSALKTLDCQLCNYARSTKANEADSTSPF